jgi:cytochrome c553
VGRTSLKLRNPSLNQPDDWERSILEQFETRLANGEPAKTMSHAEVVETASGKSYRYMKAIPTAEICLTCHGKELDPSLAEALDEAYPEDQARGYSAGDIRGAFTLHRPL